MRLSEIRISNFCSCESVHVPLGKFNPIVGYNNSGKSNILRAINWLLKKTVLPTHIFWDAAVPITVEGVIDDVNIELLPPNQRQAVSVYLNAGSLKFRRRQDTPGCPVGQLRIDVYNFATNGWVNNPAGLDNALAVLFPEPLYIEAMEDAGEDVAKFGAKNTLGLLLKQVLAKLNKNNAPAVAAIASALAQVSSHLNGQHRMAELSSFEADASSAISAFFPGISLHLNFTPLDIDDLFKSSTIMLSDSQGCPRPFSSFGHGAQRSAHMALIKLLADLTATATENAGGTVVLMIDEPELYLHPQAVELLRESLLQLSNQNFQVIFSTHSPLLIGRAHALQTLMIFKDQANKTTVRQKLTSAAASFAAHPHHAEAVFSIQAASHLLFSNNVLLVEGKTEQMLLPQIYQVVRGHSYAHDMGCIVSGSSSSALIPMMKILAGVGFVPRALADLDFVFKIAPGEGLVDQASAPFVACLNWFAMQGTAQGILLDGNGLPTRKGQNGAVSPFSAAEAFELMAVAMPAEVRQLTQVLLAHNIWIWSRGAIEAHLGIAKTDAARLSFLTIANQNNNILHASNPQDLQAFAQWM
jgi:putative ATP-dependent endonuclease of OLD family